MRGIFVIIKFLFISVLLVSLPGVYALEQNKTVNAVEYTNALKKEYIEEDKAIKNPEKLGFSTTPGSKFWRGVRSGNSYQTQVKGHDAGVFINASGETWRLYKDKISNTSGVIIGLALLLPTLLFFLFGKFKLGSGFSGNNILRFTTKERVIHWGTATLFILLAITGLILALGKVLLIPVIGKQSFAEIATLVKFIHNVSGPVFSVFLLLMIIKFIKDNIYQKGDINWLLKGGGLFGAHVDAWRFNLGEKGWFWIVFFAGILVSITGYALLFTDLIAGQRGLSELSQVVHAISSALMITAMFGHIYMGVAMEGSMSAMTTGKVDKNWAKEHHSLWHKNL